MTWHMFRCLAVYQVAEQLAGLASGRAPARTEPGQLLWLGQLLWPLSGASHPQLSLLMTLPLAGDTSA